MKQHNPRKKAHSIYMTAQKEFTAEFSNKSRMIKQDTMRTLKQSTKAFSVEYQAQYCYEYFIYLIIIWFFRPL